MSHLVWFGRQQLQREWGIFVFFPGFFLMQCFYLVKKTCKTLITSLWFKVFLESKLLQLIVSISAISSFLMMHSPRSTKKLHLSQHKNHTQFLHYLILIKIANGFFQLFMKENQKFPFISRQYQKVMAKYTDRPSITPYHQNELLVICRLSV